MSSSETPLEQAWEAYGGDPIPPRHGWVKVRCVLHGDRNASAQVHVELQKWRCFAGCGYGDVYDLIGIHDSVREFPEQKRIAADKFGDEPDAPPEPSSMNPRPKSRTTKSKAKRAWKPSWL